MSRFCERRSVCRTDTQYVVQLSGYTWALQQLTGEDRPRILDAACGTGFGTYALAHGASTAVGVDLAPEAIAKARARYQAPRLFYLIMDVVKLAFRSATFDAVISQDTIEHVPDDEGFVAEAARVLRRLHPLSRDPHHQPGESLSSSRVQSREPSGPSSALLCHGTPLRTTPGARSAASRGYPRRGTAVRSLGAPRLGAAVPPPPSRKPLAF